MAATGLVDVFVSLVAEAASSVFDGDCDEFFVCARRSSNRFQGTSLPMFGPEMAQTGLRTRCGDRSTMLWDVVFLSELWFVI